MGSVRCSEGPPKSENENVRVRTHTHIDAVIQRPSSRNTHNRSTGLHDNLQMRFYHFLSATLNKYRAVCLLAGITCRSLKIGNKHMCVTVWSHSCLFFAIFYFTMRKCKLTFQFRRGANIVIQGQPFGFVHIIKRQRWKQIECRKR